MLDARSCADFSRSTGDNAFVADVIFISTITVVQASSVEDATSDSQHNGLAAEQAAVIPQFSSFDGLSSSQLLAISNASSRCELVSAAGRLSAFVHDIFPGDLLVGVETFTTLGAAHADGVEQGFLRVLSAGENLVAIFPRLSGSVFLAVMDTRDWFEGHVVAAGLARASVVVVVEVATDRNFVQVFGDARSRHDAAALANVDDASTFDFGAFRIAAWAAAGVLDSAIVVGWESQRRGRSQKTYDQGSHG